MITKEEIKSHIKLLEAHMRFSSIDPMKYKKADKMKLDMLKTCLRYIETNPSEAFIDSEIARIQNKIELIEKSVIDAINPETYREIQQKIMKEILAKYDIVNLKQQLAALKFIRK
jgi:hypothetical protein